MSGASDGLLLQENGGTLTQETGYSLLLDYATIVLLPTVPYPAPGPTLASVLRTSHVPVARLLFLEADLVTVIHEVPAKLIDGSVTMERSRDTHRSATVSLVNDDGTYDMTDSSSLVWPNRIVRIERGAMVGGSAQYVPLITGVIDDLGDGDNTAAVSFTVTSRLHLADRQFSGPVSFAAGELVRVVIRSIAELAGLGTSDALYDMSDGGQTLVAARTFDIADNMLASMVKLAFDTGCELYDTGAGVLVLRPFVDPATVTPAWAFTPGTDATLLSRGRQLKALPGVFNRAIAIGSGPDTYPIRAEAKVTNPADPLYWTPEFDYPKEYRSANIQTQQMANAVAARMLIEGALAEESSGAATVPIPLLMETGRPVVTYGGVAHLLERVTCPVGLGSMSTDSTRVRSLVA